MQQKKKKKEGIIPFKPYSSWNMGFKDRYSYPDSSQQINLAEASQRTEPCNSVPRENFGTATAAPNKKKSLPQIFLLQHHNFQTIKEQRSSKSFSLGYLHTAFSSSSKVTLIFQDSKQIVWKAKDHIHPHLLSSSAIHIKNT